MGIFRSREKKSGTSETTSKDVAMSLDDAKLQEDLEDMVEEQKEEAEKEAIKKQLDDAELQHLTKLAETELTDTSEAHLYLRLAQNLIDEKKREFSYREVIKIAIAYVRIGEVQEALKLINQLDLPTQQYMQTLKWEKEVNKLNPFSYYRTKTKELETNLPRWKFKDSTESDYSGRRNSLGEIEVISDALSRTQSPHEAVFKEQLSLSRWANLTELQGMSPKEYVLAMLAYYSGWLGGVSTVENVKKFASTLKDPAKDFELKMRDDPGRPTIIDHQKQFETQYGALKERFQKKGPSVIKKVIATGELLGTPGQEAHTARRIDRIVIINFLIDTALAKFKENQHDVADDKDKELIKG